MKTQLGTLLYVGEPRTLSMLSLKSPAGKDIAALRRVAKLMSVKAVVSDWISFTFLCGRVDTELDLN